MHEKSKLKAWPCSLPESQSHSLTRILYKETYQITKRSGSSRIFPGNAYRTHQYRTLQDGKQRQNCSSIETEGNVGEKYMYKNERSRARSGVQDECEHESKKEKSGRKREREREREREWKERMNINESEWKRGTHRRGMTYCDATLDIILFSFFFALLQQHTFYFFALAKCADTIGCAALSLCKCLF